MWEFVVLMCRRGLIIVRKCLIVIVIKVRVDMDRDILFRKLYILYKNVFLSLWIRKVLDLVILFIMKCGSKNIVISRLDIVMFII